MEQRGLHPTGTPDFSIRRLDGPRLRSPLKLSTVTGDQIANFVDDRARILYDDRPSAAPPAAGEAAASLELAGPRQWVRFDPREVRAAIVTCGGLCPGLNDVVQALVFELTYHYGVKDILGIRYGYWGMVPENGHHAIPLTPAVVENIHHQGGAYLGTSRGPQDVARMLDFLASRRINILFTIGGDGTQRGGLALARAARERGQEFIVVGVPKTIDNDLAYTDRTFGFETACSAAREVLFAGHAEAHGAMNGVCVVKLMGRESGFIAATAALASGEANFVLVPEIPFDLEGRHGLLAALEKRLRARRHALLVVAEGAGQEHVRGAKGQVEHDASGNIRLGDIGTFLRDRIQDHFHQKEFPAVVRYIDPSYFIRSQPANASDHIFCTTLAQNAVHAAMTGRTELVVGRWHGSHVHIPMATAVSYRKRIDPDGVHWLSVMQATGQPAVMREV